MRPDPRRNPRGGRIEREAPVQVSNVMLLCQNSECERHDKPVRTHKQADEKGNKQRVCIKCGKPILTPE